MQHFPIHIKEIFFKTAKGDMSIEDFEKWLYEHPELQQYIANEDYLELISFSFKNSHRIDFFHLLNKFIDSGEFETYKMMELLTDALSNRNRLPQILEAFYDLYCNGYYFLQDLGLVYGIPVMDKRVDNEYSNVSLVELINSFYPGLEKELLKVKNWLESKEIILTGEYNELGHYGYRDLRTSQAL